MKILIYEPVIKNHHFLINAFYLNHIPVRIFSKKFDILAGVAQLPKGSIFICNEQTNELDFNKIIKEICLAGKVHVMVQVENLEKTYLENMKKMGVKIFLFKTMMEEHYMNMFNVSLMTNRITFVKETAIKVVPTSKKPTKIVFLPPGQKIRQSFNVIQLSIFGVILEASSIEKLGNLKEKMILREVDLQIDANKIPVIVEVTLIKGNKVVLKFAKLKKDQYEMMAQYLYFTIVEQDRILLEAGKEQKQRIEISTAPRKNKGGNTLDHQGNVIR